MTDDLGSPPERNRGDSTPDGGLADVVFGFRIAIQKAK